MEIIASLSSARLEPAWSAASVAGAPGAAAPDAAAVQQFAALMQAPAPAAASAAVQGLDAQPGAPGPLSVGERMLHSMQGVSNDFRDSMARVSETLRSDNGLNGQQLLGLQMEVSLASVQMELVSKAISRSNQNLDQLVRLQ